MLRYLLIAMLTLTGISGCADSKSDSATGSQNSKKQKRSPEDEKAYPPCHPGCFPAGTMIATPEGLRAIETIRVDELVTLAEVDGKSVSGSVLSIFRSRNMIFEVQTDDASIKTTKLQPLCLANGEYKSAGDLKPGDLIWRWVNGKRIATRVKQVTSTEQEADVFNLVVGESKVFIAGSFLAKGKPPLKDGDTEGN